MEFQLVTKFDSTSSFGYVRAVLARCGDKM